MLGTKPTRPLRGSAVARTAARMLDNRMLGLAAFVGLLAMAIGAGGCAARSDIDAGVAERAIDARDDRQRSAADGRDARPDRASSTTASPNCSTTARTATPSRPPRSRTASLSSSRKSTRPRPERRWSQVLRASRAVHRSGRAGRSRNARRSPVLRARRPVSRPVRRKRLGRLRVKLPKANPAEGEMRARRRRRQRRCRR